MKSLMRRSAAAFFVLFMMFSIGLWQSSTAEAAANIKWTTTSVSLNRGECRIEGYFKNEGDLVGTVSKIKFVVNTWDITTGTAIYSVAWDAVPSATITLEPGAQANWFFKHLDQNCPAYMGENGRWNVVPTVWVK